MAEQRLLGLDVGDRRIGVALSDALGMLASPLTTINANPRSQAITMIARLVREHEVQGIVVGLPLTLRGEIGPQAEQTRSFAQELERQVGLPVMLFDERYTTTVAEQLLREMGVKPEKRKQQIDQVAASIILQDYLDHIRNGGAGGYQE
ncbi:Holliday junction resolvase YqgF [Oscillochloris trichoides DG-6]|uniref:Putative pre-16S rRNA nuclease n=1 Tax=Oscillochloris trichoides DG-6 TaxID=765420 RepID=E1IER5_9CHLR|nr:Holliday junction resolvase RuvX [Oscillochloris trichoides]EFO80357.1 Holliday junction resolvase YqgF [Oscillochloris trichoides DG-6]